MTIEKNLEMEHGKGHVTVTTVPCKLQQWDRYCVPFHHMTSHDTHQHCFEQTTVGLESNFIHCLSLFN